MHLRSSDVRWFLLGLVLVFAGAAIDEARAQAQNRCQVLRLHPGGILEQCDNQLRSLVLELGDISRQGTLDPSGAFAFVCPLEEMCPDAPSITGWLIDPRRWTGSGRDQQAIFEIFQQTPRGSAGGFIAGAPLSAQPASACPVFEVEVAGLPGRGACYQSDGPMTSAIVIVAANNEIGYVFAFYQRDADWQTLQERVRRLVPKFRIAVETGDIGLLKWMR